MLRARDVVGEDRGGGVVESVGGVRRGKGEWLMRLMDRSRDGRCLSFVVVPRPAWALVWADMCIRSISQD